MYVLSLLHSGGNVKELLENLLITSESSKRIFFHAFSQPAFIREFSNQTPGLSISEITPFRVERGLILIHYFRNNFNSIPHRRNDRSSTRRVRSLALDKSSGTEPG